MFIGRFFPQLLILCLFLIVTEAGSCAFKLRSHWGNRRQHSRVGRLRRGPSFCTSLFLPSFSLLPPPLLPSPSRPSCCLSAIRHLPACRTPGAREQPASHRDGAARGAAMESSRGVRSRHCQPARSLSPARQLPASQAGCCRPDYRCPPHHPAPLNHTPVRSSGTREP